MGVKKTVDRLPKNTMKAYQDIVRDSLPAVMPSFIPTIIQSTLTTSQIKPVGNYTLSLNDSGKAICGGNGTIFVPTNQRVAFPVVTTVNIVTEDNEYLIKAVSNNVTNIYYNNSPVSGDWIIPPRTIAKLCKVGTDTWNIQGENIIRF